MPAISCFHSRRSYKSVRCRWQTRATQTLSACWIFSIASYGNQTISFARPSCWIRWVGSTVADGCQKFMTLTGEQGWKRLRRSTVPEVWSVPTKI